MIELALILFIVLCSICELWLMLKIHKANEFINWSKSVEDIDNVISQRVFIVKMEMDTRLEFLRINRAMLAVSCLVFFMQTI